MHYMANGDSKTYWQTVVGSGDQRIADIVKHVVETAPKKPVYRVKAGSSK